MFCELDKIKNQHNDFKKQTKNNCLKEKDFMKK